jgi:hypothetical protein
MARRTAATFGYAALILQLMLGWIAGWDVDLLLACGLAAMLIASLVGWTAGTLACELAFKHDSDASKNQR